MIFLISFLFSFEVCTDHGGGSADHTTDSEGICLICRLWGRLSLQVREEFGIFLGIGR